MSMQPVVLSCSQCGEPVRGDEEFCGSCGDFLGWREPSPPAPEVVVADVPMLTAAEARDASPDGPAPVTPGGEPAGDPLAPLRLLATQAQERADAARTQAMGAQVALERARRRSTSARRRVERLEEQMPPAQERAREAERAVDRAAAASRRASSAAKGAAVGGDPAAAARAAVAGTRRRSGGEGGTDRQRRGPGERVHADGGPGGGPG